MTKNNIKINIRINSSLLHLFSEIGSVKYDIKATSKFVVNRLSKYLEESSKDCFDVSCFITPSFSYYKLDKIYTITLNIDNYKKLKLLSKTLCIDENECIRRIIYNVCFTEAFLLPQISLDKIEDRVKNDTYTKFRFSVNKEDLNLYMCICNTLYKENNLTAALNETIKNNIVKLKDSDTLFLNNILKENLSLKKLDYKYNFTIPNKRFKDFYLACENIGLSPQDCLRRSISLIIKENKKLFEVDK